MQISFPFYDKDKIGKLITWGNDHLVFDYDTNSVIKFSLLEWFMGANGRIKTIKDYSISKQFFGKYLLETEIKISPTGKYIVAIQPKITGHYLSKKDLSDLFIKKQFIEIMHGYTELVKAGHPKIDLIGHKGIFKNFMSNIFVTPEKKLLIIDTSLLELAELSLFLKPIYYLVRAYAHWRQKNVIQHFTA